MMKKILYVAFKHEYGKPESGLTLNYKAWYENFIDLGYQVESVFYDELSKEDLQKKIISQALSFQPDLIFFVLQKDQILFLFAGTRISRNFH